MTSAGLQLSSRADIEAEIAALRQAGRHIVPVRWQGQPAWLKLSLAQPPAWRYRLLAGMARLLQHPALQPVRPHGGAAGIRNEARRLVSLTDAGLRVPQLLAHDDHWLLISDIGHITRSKCCCAAARRTHRRRTGKAAPATSCRRIGRAST